MEKHFLININPKWTKIIQIQALAAKKNPIYNKLIHKKLNVLHLIEFRGVGKASKHCSPPLGGSKIH